MIKPMILNSGGEVNIIWPYQRILYTFSMIILRYCMIIVWACTDQIKRLIIMFLFLKKFCFISFAWYRNIYFTSYYRYNFASVSQCKKYRQR